MSGGRGELIWNICWFADGSISQYRELMTHAYFEFSEKLF